jgi:hypothetical protein
MNIATLRVDGPETSLGILQHKLGLSVDVQWSAGEKRREGAIRDSSGFNATIADTEGMAELTDTLRAFLARCASEAVVFPWLGVTAEIDIGFSAGDCNRFFGGFRLAAADLRACAQCGLDLSVTAYPTSDDANGT